jgi:DNA-binding winged helix-turn-helix (wHTH) protein/Tol biopolymer transport system component
MPTTNRKDAPFPAPRPQRITFDRFEVDLRSGELRKAGHRIRLQAQPFELLAMLLDHAGEVVTREEVCRRLWPEDTFVDFDHSLAAAINKIREALGDSAENPRFVETLPKRGYRFIAEIRRELPPALMMAAVPEKAATPGLSPDSVSEVDRDESEVEGTATETIPPQTAKSQAQPAVAKSLWLMIGLAAAVVIVLVGWLGARGHRRPAPASASYTQLTNFSDAVFSPAISPDGRTIAFIRGNAASFPSVGEIYTKVLPNGEPLQLTHDGWDKYGVAFSPDGSRVVYTRAGLPGWDTVTISAFGGEPRVLLPNAAGLTWLDEQHVLFSEIKSGLHMGVVTSTFNRSGQREIYFPEHERGMAHYSYASPDRKWILVAEMGGSGDWQRCRLLPFDGSSPGTQVGPNGACLSAAWSPDGQWMYFSAWVDGQSHLWRQPFPTGDPEQITFGPTQQEGVAATLDGRSLVSAVGINESGVWLHDAKGERLISAEGSAFRPAFSRDGQLVYYLLSRDSPALRQELWVTDLGSGKSTPVVEGFSIEGFDVSADGKLAVFGAWPASGEMQIWLAACDHSSPPRMLASSGERYPFFGPDDNVVFQAAEGNNNFLFRMKLDGSGRTKVSDSPITHLIGASPDGLLAVAIAPANGSPTTAMIAVPFRGGSIVEICPATCNLAKWSPDGSRFYVEPLGQRSQSGATAAIPVPPGKSLPVLPASGISSPQDFAGLPHSKVIDLASFKYVGQDLAPGVAPDTFVYARTAVHRNIFQIPVP